MHRLVLLVTMVTACAAARPGTYEWDMTNQDESKVKTRKDVLDFHSEHYRAVRKPIKVTGFSYNDCGGTGAMVNIAKLAISPDPLSFPGSLNVSTSFLVKGDLNQPLKLELYLAKKLLGKYLKIPCIDNIGSCTYPDMCQLLEQVECPAALVKIGIDCKCPLKAKAYTVTNAGFTVDTSFIPSGHYKIKANVTYNDKEVVCVEMVITIK